MALHAPIKFKYGQATTYPGTLQKNWPGVERGYLDNTAMKRGIYYYKPGNLNGPVLDTAMGGDWLYYISTDGALGNIIRYLPARRDFNDGFDAFLPNLNGSTPGPITVARVLPVGNFLYVCGDWQSVDGLPAQAYLCRINLTTGAVDTSYTPAINGPVYCMAHDPSTDNLHIFGDFTIVNGSGRTRGACLDYYGGLVSWGGNPNINGIVRDCQYVPSALGFYAATTGSIVIGGDFTSVWGAARNYMAEVATYPSGGVTGLDPNANGAVYALKYRSWWNDVLAGGDFTNIGGLARNRLAVVRKDNSAGLWNPNANGRVFRIEASEDYVYAVGSFTVVDTIATPYAVKLSPNNQAVGYHKFSWAPTLTGVGGYGVTDPVRALALYQNTVFLGGDYSGAGPGVWPDGGSPGSYVGFVPYLNAFSEDLFTDADTLFVNKTGSDSNLGTFASPLLTVYEAMNRAGSLYYKVCITDSGTYNEVAQYDTSIKGFRLGAEIRWRTSTSPRRGLFSLDGAMPTLTCYPGAEPDTYGARRTGRKAFYTGGGTVYHVSKNGDNTTGLTEETAFTDVMGAFYSGGIADGDCIQIDDDETYYIGSEMDLSYLGPGINNLTVQAKDGKVPTLLWYSIGVGATGFVTGAGNFNLYGLRVVGQVASSNYTDFATSNTGTLVVKDCSFSLFDKGISHVVSNKTLTVENCLFENCGTNGIEVEDSTGTAYKSIVNCYFTGNAGETGNVAAAGVGLNMTGATGIWYCDRLTFTDYTNFAAFAVRKNATTGAEVVLSRGDFTNISGHGVFVYEQTGNAMAGYFNAHVVNFYNITGCAMFFDWSTSGGATNTFNSVSVDRFVVRKCNLNKAMRGGIEVRKFLCGGAGFWFRDGFLARCYNSNLCAHSEDITRGPSPTVYNLTSVSALTTVEDLQTAIGSTYQNGNGLCGSGGFGSFTSGSTSSSGSRSVITQGNRVGVWTDGYPSPYIGGPTFKPWFSCFGDNLAVTGATNYLDTTGLGVVLEDPRLNSITEDAEDCSLAPDSPVFDTAGPRYYLLGSVPNTLMEPYGIVTGINFDLRPCWHAGLFVSTYTGSSRVRVHHNNFGPGGLWGVRFDSVKTRVENNAFTTAAAGVVVFSATDITNNIFIGCSGGIVLTGSDATASFNSTFLCGYGQFERDAATGSILTDNILSDSGLYDYAGLGTQERSDVGTVGGEATLVNCLRANPLFSDPFNNDLRLQSAERGYAFTSPAKGAGLNGADMGAYGFIYGSPVATFTLLDFATPGWRNPDNAPETVVAVKLAEGERDDGSTFSRPNAYKREWTLEWAEKNDMPEAQRNAIIAMFQVGSEDVEVSFDDGSTWVPVSIVKSNSLAHNELTGAYTQDDVPRPLQTLTIRER